LKRTKQKYNFFHRLLFIINIILLSLLIFSYVAPYIPPKCFLLVAFLGLAYPYLLIANLLFIIIWILLHRYIFLYSLIAILIGFNHIGKFIQFKCNLFESEKQLPPNNSTNIKILSFNVRLFDYYKQNKNNPNTRTDIFKFIEKEKPDIACFQEYLSFNYAGNKFVNTDSIMKINGLKYHSSYEIKKDNKTIKEMYVATFSRFPIINKGLIPLDNKKKYKCNYVDIKIYNKIIRIYNVHLESIRFGKEDYEFIEDIDEQSNQNKIKRIYNIISKIGKAYLKRNEEVNILRQELENCPYPYIICGDFNDTPISYTYNQISKNLYDGFVESGCGIANTYVGSFPSFKIDYIMYSKKFNSKKFNIYKKIRLSDHYPISIEIII